MPSPDDPLREMLFGMLALRNGLVSREQFAEALSSTVDLGPGPRRRLSELGALSDSRRTLIEALTAEHLQAHGNDASRSLAALALDPSTRELLAAAGGPSVEATLSHIPTGSGPADRAGLYAVGEASGEGQRFRVLRPHARGGLGAVFVAIDTELHREVALKQIQDHRADDPASRRRFLAEAEITGGLEHPGIVPVYGLGTYEGGRPYYAMRFIRGDSLKDAIDAFPKASKGKGSAETLAFRRLLKRFTDVCNAIEYAHSRGVLHRDIKPGNVIVGKHGETMVVDWGLAKPRSGGEIDPAEPSLTPKAFGGSSETLPGQAMGTPAYMSPEQASGDLDHLGVRSDVYSLGATLYYLLTGKAPISGPTAEAMLAAARSGDFPPPRHWDPSIPRGLESICLKAMARDPDDRYPTARALADDVERWLADEPVTARRDGLPARLARWGRRHGAWVRAGIAALVLVSLVATAAALSIQHARKGERQALGRATESRREALLNLYLARAQLILNEWNNARVERARSLLAEQVPEAGGPDWRGFEWGYMDRLTKSELAT